MEQRISYTIGLDLPTPVGRPAFGGCFGLESNVPSALRGPEEGFAAAVLLRPRTAEWNGADPIAQQFLAGCYDFVNAAGWAFVMQTGYILRVFCGSVVLDVALDIMEDSLALLTWDGTNAFLYVNGVEVFNAAPTYVTGPDNFGIGGTPDSSFTTVLGPAAWGALNVHIGGVMVATPMFESKASGTWTASPPVEQFASVFSALDMVDAQPSPVPAADPAFPAANYLWSTRRGLPQLRDNSNAPWADEVEGLELARLGLKTGASVAAFAPDWSDNTFVYNDIPPS